MTAEPDRGGEVSDDELARLALAADPEQAVDPDAVPLPLAGPGTSLLPDWYMPAPASIAVRPARRWVLGGIVVALIVINGAGLCVTYGIAEIAW